MYFHLAAYLPALLLALYLLWINWHFSPDDMMLIGIVGMLWLFYMLLVCIISGLCFAGSLQAMLFCAGRNFILITIIYLIGMPSLFAPLYGAAGAIISLAAGGAVMLVHYFLAF